MQILWRCNGDISGIKPWMALIGGRIPYVGDLCHVLHELVMDINQPS
jgi:hypothetical protein